LYLFCIRRGHLQVDQLCSCPDVGALLAAPSPDLLILLLNLFVIPNGVRNLSGSFNLFLNLNSILFLNRNLNLVSSRAPRDLLHLYAFEFALELDRHSERSEESLGAVQFALEFEPDVTFEFMFELVRSRHPATLWHPRRILDERGRPRGTEINSSPPSHPFNGSSKSGFGMVR
jgi:hypothetical protein